MSAVERSMPAGFAIPRPAMSGAEPWTGSKIPGPPSPRLAEGASPSPPVIAAARSERMSPNMFSVTMTSNCSGARRELHGGVVDEHVLDLDVRIVGRDLVDDAAPEPRRLEHVRLVHRRELPAARPGELEASARDSLDLARVVLARVEDGAVVADAARAEVEAADELAHDDEVDSCPLAPAGGSRTRRARRGAGAFPAPAGRPPRRTRDGRSGAFSTASADRHASSVAGGSESPVCRIASAPKRWSSSSTSGARTPSTRCATAITSGPMQSPGRQATLKAIARAY